LPKESDVGDRATVEALPVPVRVTVWGLEGSPSVIERVAVREPVAAGVKVTLTVQLAPPARLDPQVFVCPNSVGSVPLKVKAVTGMAAVPPFVTVTVLAVLGVPTTVELNVMDLGELVRAAVSVPVSVAVVGVITALSAIEMDAVRLPLPCGVNVTVMVQVPLIAMSPLQLFVCVKSDGFVPVTVIEEILRSAVPVFCTLMVFDTLGVRYLVLEKVRDLGVSVTTGAPIGTPLTLTFCGVVGSESLILSVPEYVINLLGTKLIDTVQLPPAATEVPQVFVWLKPAGTVILVIPRAVDPSLVRVTIWVRLVTPMVTLPKSNDEVESRTAVDGTVIVRAAVRVTLPVLARTVTV
jgi:hypothetical protein